MGRLAARVIHNSEMLELVHINELKGGTETAAHLLEFDSVHGRWPHAVHSDASNIYIYEQTISFSDHATPAAVPWDSYEIDVVLECSGKFRT